MGSDAESRPTFGNLGAWLGLGVLLGRRRSRRVP